MFIIECAYILHCDMSGWNMVNNGSLLGYAYCLLQVGFYPILENARIERKKERIVYSLELWHNVEIDLAR